MKANELMIGDWVTFKDCQHENPMPIKIIAIGFQADEEDDCLVQIDGDKACDIIEINDEIVGIPLTAEILEKNGFEKRNRYQWEYRDGYCKIVIDIAPQIEIDGEILGTPPINVKIEGALFELNRTDDWYIHELQHALRLCGIEKEITI